MMETTNDMPTVIIGHDMSPELAADVSTALQGMGVVVKTNGFAPPPRQTARSSSWCRPRAAPARPPSPPTSPSPLAQRLPGRVVAVDLDVQFGDMGTALALHAGAHPGPGGSHRPRSTPPPSSCSSRPTTAVCTSCAAPTTPVEADVDHPRARVEGDAAAGSGLRLRGRGHAGRSRRAHAGGDRVRHRSAAGVEPRRDQHPQLRKAVDALDHIGVKANRHFVLNRADAKVGLNPSDADEAVGMTIACTIPSSREIPLSMNVGTPVVISEPKSAVAKQLQQLAHLFAPVTMPPSRSGGLAAMSLSERINQAQQAAAQRGDVASTWRQAPNQTLTVDGLADFKAKVHDALFERLGTRLFETQNEEQLQSLGGDRDRRPHGRRPRRRCHLQERQHLVRDIARDVMGLGPIEQFLADPTVTEVMVNGTDFIYVERDGVIEQTRARFISEEHLRRVIDRIVSSGRAVASTSHRRWSTLACPTGRASTSSCRRCRWTARSSPSASSPRTPSRRPTWSPWAR